MPEANQILDNIHYNNENIAVTFEVYVTSIKESYKILKYHGGVHNDSYRVHILVRAICSDVPVYLHTAVGLVQMVYSSEQ